MSKKTSTSITRFTPKPPKPLPKPKVPAGLGLQASPEKLRKGVIRQYGPRMLGRFAEVIVTQDWSIPPAGFLGAHVSASEWMIYAAISFVKGDPPNPRKPPYIGGVTWHYQSSLDGGRLERGGQVCDFLVDEPNQEEMCIRLQTERFHVQAEHRKIAQDFYLKTHTRGARLVDIYEQDYIGDKTLKSACRVVANALAGREEYNPSLVGTTRRVR